MKNCLRSKCSCVHNTFFSISIWLLHHSQWQQRSPILYSIYNLCDVSEYLDSYILRLFLLQERCLTEIIYMFLTKKKYIQRIIHTTSMWVVLCEKTHETSFGGVCSCFWFWYWVRHGFMTWPFFFRTFTLYCDHFVWLFHFYFQHFIDKTLLTSYIE